MVTRENCSSFTLSSPKRTGICVLGNPMRIGPDHRDTDFALRHVGSEDTVEVTVFLNFLNIHERRSGYNVVLYHINYSYYHTTYFSKVK